MTLGERIRYLREKQGMSLNELAEKVGYKERSSVQKIEKGIRDVSHTQLIRFAKALNTTPHYLLGWLQNENDVVPVADSPPGLTEDEQELIGDFRKLNAEGKAAAAGAVKAFTMLDQYKKSGQNELAV